MAKDPEERFRSMEELSIALQQYLADIAHDLHVAESSSAEVVITTDAGSSESLSKIASLKHDSFGASSSTQNSGDAPRRHSDRVRSSSQYPPTKLMIAAGFLGLVLLAAVLVRVYDRHGKQVAETRVPDGGQIVVESSADSDRTTKSSDEPAELAAASSRKVSATAPGVSTVGPSAATFQRTELESGEPLGPSALVLRPAPLPQVNSWTLETLGHRGGVDHCHVSPGDQWVVTAGQDGTTRIWELSTGEILHVFYGDGEPPRSVSWSADGRLAMADSRLHIWDMSSGLEVAAPKSTTRMSSLGRPPTMGWPAVEIGARLTSGKSISGNAGKSLAS